MTPSRLIHGEGTPAQVWREAAQWAALPLHTALDLVAAGQRLVVVAPHPDDEVLSAGGLLAECARLGRQVLVVAVTDGGASHPGSTVWPAQTLPGVRRAESERALRQLGISADAVSRLGVADGAVAAGEAEVSAQLQAELGPRDVVIAPWELDGHPDHEAVSRAAAAAAAAAGAEFLQAPIWGWHWASPDQPEFDWQRAFAVLHEPMAKAAAIAEYQSQLTADPSTGAEPILPAWALRRLVHDREVFFRRAV